MRLLSRRTLREYWESRIGHADQGALQGACEAWVNEIENASWSTMAELKQQFGTASPVSSDRVVFNIKGNDYRLVVSIDFEKQLVFVKWIGTHEEYDEIDVKEVSYVRRH